MDIHAIISNDSFQFYLRLLVACILGGFIGYERESMHRPAGFRTHILVCVGAALVMTTSEYIFKIYMSRSNLDPARLGAQVISGIGFLGAGTIIREGFNVKGLTTAASLWAVSCVGIAVGIGFYEGAIAATIIIYITLILLKKMEEHFKRKNEHSVFYVQTVNIPGQIGAISSVFGSHSIQIKNIEFMEADNSKDLLVKLVVDPAADFPKEKIIGDLQNIEGIRKVYED